MDRMAKAYYKIKGVFPHASVFKVWCENGDLLSDYYENDKFRFDFDKILIDDVFTPYTGYGRIVIDVNGTIDYNFWENFKYHSCKIETGGSR